MSVATSSAATSSDVTSLAVAGASSADGDAADRCSGAGDPAPGVDLRAEVMAVGSAWARALCRLVHLVRDLDSSGDWVLDGSRTCAHWVASVLDVEVCTAREWLRIGRALAGLPEIDAAFSSGRISYSKVRQLTRIASPELEGELLQIAERVPAGRLGVELARWLAGHEEPADTEDRHRAAREVSWRTDIDGMVVGRFRLAPADAAAVIAAIDSSVMAYRGPAHASADASADGAQRWPSVSQQRADALVGLVTGGGLGVTTEVVLHVRGDGCSLDDGTPLAGSVLEKLVPGSFLRALIHDAHGRPIDASGRHRHPSTRQKRVVRERDQGCVDCGARNLLEFDHDPPYAVSGRTVIDELHLRCWTCHRARHATGARPRRTRRGNEADGG